MTTDLDQDEKDLLAAKIAWLSSADPDDWHRVLLDFNWDEPLYLLDWIVRQPACDAATALTIFWSGEPAAWLDEEGAGEEEPNGYSYLNQQICAYVANRVKAGGYTRSEIAFAPTTWTKKDYVDLAASAEALAKPNIPVSRDLILSRAGREVDLNADFYARYPEPFHLSYFDEQFSADIEQGLYETPRSIATGKAVDEVERQTLAALPEWLRGPPVAAAARPKATEASTIQASAAEANDPSDDASARIRSLRRRTEAEPDAESEVAKATGIAGWLKRLLGR